MDLWSVTFTYTCGLRMAPRGLVGTQRLRDWPGSRSLNQSREGQENLRCGLSPPPPEGMCPDGGCSLGGPPCVPHSQPNIVPRPPPPHHSHSGESHSRRDPPSRWQQAWPRPHAVRIPHVGMHPRWGAKWVQSCSAAASPWSQVLPLGPHSGPAVTV